MLNPLIAVMGCEPRVSLMEIQKQTWAADSPLDVHFFTGPELSVADGYWWDLCYKIQAICKWALARGYTHLFKCDDDTYVRPERLLTSGFEQHDYVGMCQTPNGRNITSSPQCEITPVYIKNQIVNDPQHDACSFMAGGCGYWLSEKAMRIIAEAPLLDSAEDRNNGKVLYAAGIRFVHDDRYKVIFPVGKPGPAGGVYPLEDLLTFTPLASNDVIACCEFKGEHQMLRAHRFWMESHA